MGALPEPASVAPSLDGSAAGDLARLETTRLLHLARAQIEDSLTEADASVGSLLDALRGLLGELDGLGALADPPERGGPPSAVVRERMAANGRDVVRAMQFYDRLNQRIGHLRDSLAALSVLFEDPGRAGAPAAWMELHERIRAMYSNEPDRRLFDAVMGGAPAAVGVVPAADEGAGELELF